MKTCRTCKQEKPVTAFAPYGCGTSRHVRCLDCEAAHPRKHYKLPIDHLVPVQGEPVTVEELAELMGISRARVNQIELAALKKLGLNRKTAHLVRELLEGVGEGGAS